MSTPTARRSPRIPTHTARYRPGLNNLFHVRSITMFSLKSSFVVVVVVVVVVDVVVVVVVVFK